MDIDLFEDEQKIFNDSVALVAAVKNGEQFDFSEYAKLSKEYGRLLKHLRRSTRIADRTTIDLHESNVDLTDKVHYDALTGIYNRRFLEDDLARVIRSLARSGGDLSVLMMDIDFFKKYNDTYGHNQGDFCLKTVAETISGSLLRSDDFIARYGGEEFAVVLPNTDAKGALVLAAKIIANIRTRNIPHEKSEIANCVTISIGITASKVLHGQSGEEYIKRADEALYMSKQRGRNRYTYLDFEEANV